MLNKYLITLNPKEIYVEVQAEDVREATILGMKEFEEYFSFGIIQSSDLIVKEIK